MQHSLESSTERCFQSETIPDHRRCEITLVLAQPRFQHSNPNRWGHHIIPPESSREGHGLQVARHGVPFKHGRQAAAQGQTQGYLKLEEFLRKGLPLETMVRRMRNSPSENLGKVHWLERILEKEIDKESKSLEQLVTGFGRFSKRDDKTSLRDLVARVVRSGEFYKSEGKEPLETEDGRMTELGVAVLNSVLKLFLEHAYSLANKTQDSEPNTIRVPGYLVLSDVHPSEKPELKENPPPLKEHVKTAYDGIHVSPRGRHQSSQSNIFHMKEDGKELPLRPWKSLVTPKPDVEEKTWRWKTQSKAVSGNERKSTRFLLPKWRQKMNQAINSIPLVNDLKTAVSIKLDNSGGTLHRYRSGESTQRNRLGRQWERFRRSDVSNDEEGIRLELKELLNTITNKSGEADKPEEDSPNDVTTLPRVAFALPKKLLMDSTTAGPIKMSKYHCHKFMPSCARYASACRNHWRQSPTSELVNFLLMLHSNDTQSEAASPTMDPNDEYGCYDENEIYEDDEDDYDEDDGVDFGNPFQELKITTTFNPNLGAMTPAPWLQAITCSTAHATSSAFSRPTSTTCQPPMTTCQPQTTTCQPPTTTCQPPTTTNQLLTTKPTLNPARCKSYYESMLATKDSMEKNNFFGELHLVTKVTLPSSGKAEQATRGLPITEATGARDGKAPGEVGSTAKSCLCPSGMSVSPVNTATCNVSDTVKTTETLISDKSSSSRIGPMAQKTYGKTQTYPCPTIPPETERPSLPPVPQFHEILTMAPPTPPSLPPCGVTGPAKNSINQKFHLGKASALNKKRAGPRRNSLYRKPWRRHKTNQAHHKQGRRQKSKGRPVTDDDTGLLAILADPSMPGAMKTGLWRYVPYRVVHLQDAEKPLETKHGVIHDPERAHFHGEPRLMKPLRKKLLHRLLIRDDPRRQYLEAGRNKDYDYDYDDYGTYPDEYENSP